MNNTKGRALNLRVYEKLIIALILAVFLISVFFNMTVKQKIYQLNIEIKDLQEDIVDQQNLNQAYTLEIRESTSFENLSKLANEHGLVTGNDSTFVLEDR